MMHYFAPYFSPDTSACKKERERLRELFMAIVPVINEKRKHSLSSQIQPPDGAGFITLGASAHVHIIDSKDKNDDKSQQKCHIGPTFALLCTTT